MLDGAPYEPRGTRDWKTEFKAGLNGRFRAIAEAIFHDVTARELRFDLVKQGRRALTLRVLHKDRAVCLKLFSDTAPDAQAAYMRERNCLIAFSHTGLVPRIIGFEDAARIVFTQPVEGPSATAPGNGLTPEQTGARLGEWMARLNAVAPSRKACGNWLSFFRKFPGLELQGLGPARALLADIPLCGLSLSRGDAALHNYIVTADGGLVGVDFEEARMRPHGWDYITAHNALLLRFGPDSEAALRAFRDAYHRHHRGALITDELNSVAQLFFCARALARANTAAEMTHGG